MIRNICIRKLVFLNLDTVDLGAKPSSARVGGVLHAVGCLATSLASSPQVVIPMMSADVAQCPWGRSGMDQSPQLIRLQSI